jgi:hypothetical protein
MAEPRRRNRTAELRKGEQVSGATPNGNMQNRTSLRRNVWNV